MGFRPGEAGTAPRDPRSFPARASGLRQQTRRTPATPSCLAIGIEQSGREDHRERWLQPLLDGTLRSAFSMTEPGAGADPTPHPHIGPCATATSGSSTPQVVHLQRIGGRLPHRHVCDQPRRPSYQGCSMIVVPTGTPGSTSCATSPPWRIRSPFRQDRRSLEIIYRDVRVRSTIWWGTKAKGSGWPDAAWVRAGPTTACAAGQVEPGLDDALRASVSRFVHGLSPGREADRPELVADSMGRDGPPPGS